eukprot:snap_masked-scaffold_5-processed-gene-3.24-mRNA-1 protein AED:1.00 eAED:1.00 QI:0/0/0/0/1/1/2/0/82
MAVLLINCFIPRNVTPYCYNKNYQAEPHEEKYSEFIFLILVAHYSQLGYVLFNENYYPYKKCHAAITLRSEKGVFMLFWSHR